MPLLIIIELAFIVCVGSVPIIKTHFYTISKGRYPWLRGVSIFEGVESYADDCAVFA